ncbi:MAG TPA: thioesterase domain-containing protein [Ktedonobacterales bacterium]|jgi:thioesterase domain-containing protein
MYDQREWHDLARELQAVLHHEIPLSRQMDLTVLQYNGVCLTLGAPLAPNINHKATAFAGSLNAVMTLTGWGTVWLLLAERGLHGTIVIQESATRYLLPVGHDFNATCRVPQADETERFLAGLRRRGKARLALKVDILDGDGRVAVAFTGNYVAFAHTSERPGEDV